MSYRVFRYVDSMRGSDKMGLLSTAFPQFENMRANKRLSEKAKNQDIGQLSSMFSETETMELLGEDDLKSLYEYEYTRKKGFEDKAKTNVIGITIAVSLIMGSYTMIQNIVGKYDNIIVSILCVVLFSLSVMYMISAGVMSINVINEQAIVHRIGYGLDDPNERKKDYYLQIALNRVRNAVRNNTVSSSYKCMRNALILLATVMLIAIWPYSSYDNSNHSGSSVKGNTTFFYSEECFDMVNKGIASDYVENYIIEQLNKGVDASNTVTVIDTAEKIVIKFSGDLNTVNVYAVDEYMDP